MKIEMFTEDRIAFLMETTFSWHLEGTPVRGFLLSCQQIRSRKYPISDFRWRAWKSDTSVRKTASQRLVSKKIVRPFFFRSHVVGERESDLGCILVQTCSHLRRKSSSVKAWKRLITNRSTKVECHVRVLFSHPQNSHTRFEGCTATFPNRKDILHHRRNRWQSWNPYT